ncbi:MAG: hypothetical protein HYY16_17015 [Planctomycetes bacterium]|nr:hypothetical protein [Planctomycetota bacterium]
MKKLAWSALFLAAGGAIASAQTLWTALPEEVQDVVTPDESLARISGGLTYFEIEKPAFDDGWGFGAVGQMYGWKPLIVEAGVFHLASEMRESPEPSFELTLLTVGGGFIMHVGERFMSTLTGGYVGYLSNEFDDTPDTRQGGYVALNVYLNIRGPVDLILRITGMGNERRAEIHDEGIDWITASTVGVGVAF